MPLKKILNRWYIAREKNYLKVVHSGWKITPLIIVCCSVRKNILTNYIGEHLSGVKYHIIDTAIAAEHIVLAAEELGLSSC